MNLIEGEYYKINGTKRILYWDGKEWLKPAKDQQKRYGSWLVKLETQPKIKSVEIISIEDI